MKINDTIKNHVGIESQKIRSLAVESFELKDRIHKMLPPLEKLDLEELEWILDHIAAECVWLRVKVGVLIDKTTAQTWVKEHTK